jgi:hypothetical protein
MDQAAVARARENQNALSQYTLSKARREDEQLANQILAEICKVPNFKLDVTSRRCYGRKVWLRLEYNKTLAI